MVVIHDPSLERTTEGKGPVANKMATELAATRLRDGNDEGVPTLNAVLDVYAGTAIELHIEIKTDFLGRPYQGLEKKLVDLVALRGLQQQAILTSFVPEVLETVRQLDPGQRVLGSLDRRSAELMGGLDGALARFDRIAGCIVAVEKGLLADSLDLCRQRLGTHRLGAWVPNEPDDIAFWLSQPIRRITTDRPDSARAERRKLH